MRFVQNALRRYWADALLPVGVVLLLVSALVGTPVVLAAVALALVVGQGLLVSQLAHRGVATGMSLAVWQERAEAVRDELLRFRDAAVHEDHETGLGNARQLELDWVKGVARFRRRGEPFSLVLIEISDTLGRDYISDETVAGVAGVVLRTSRAEDSVCRVGPQRFATLLSNSDRAGGDRFVRRVRVRANTELFQLGSTMGFMELNGGVAEWADEMEVLADLEEAAVADLAEFRTDFRRQTNEFQGWAEAVRSPDVA